MTSFLPIAPSISVPTSPYDNVYRSSGNTLESVSRVIKNTITRTSLPSLQLGSASSVDLPIGPLLGPVVLSLTLKGQAQIPLLSCLSAGWGWDAIRYISFSVGGSQVLRYTGEVLRVQTLQDAESGAKRDDIIALAGDPYDANTTIAATKEFTANINIYLPFSNLSSSRVCPFDSSILDRPVSVQIELKRAEEFFTFSATDAAVVRGLLPTSLHSASVYSDTSVFVDGPSESIKDLVGPSGTMVSGYPFMYPQAFVSSPLVGVPKTSNSKVSVRLDNFLNGGLQGIYLWLVRTTFDGTGSTPLSGSCHSLFEWTDMNEIELSYAGQSIYRTDNDTDELFGLSRSTVGTKSNGTSFPYTTAATVGPINSAAKANRWVYIPFAQYQTSIFVNLIQPGCSLVNNQVLLTFNTPELSELSMGNVPTTPASQPSYILHAMYQYQASVEVSKGKAEMRFVPLGAVI